jgi:hypothetical protein
MMLGWGGGTIRWLSSAWLPRIYRAEAPVAGEERWAALPFRGRGGMLTSGALSDWPRSAHRR